jgi:hypothetical protein
MSALRAARVSDHARHGFLLEDKTAVGAAGDSFDAKVYATDPTNSTGDLVEAWKVAKRRTQRHCPACEGGKLQEKPEGEKGFVCESCKLGLDELTAGLSGVNFHDLRHPAVSRMIAARVPLPIIAKIVGWATGAMAKMAAGTVTSGWKTCGER